MSYDFITRPACQHALVTGDTEYLRLMLRTVHDYGIDPASLIHALQNHDELTLELVHFWTLHAEDQYSFQGEEMSGLALRERVRSVMYERLSGANAPYNLRFVTNGVACTTASIAAAALGIRDLDFVTDEDVQRIQRLHLLLAMYNAFQPGVFALSGWDLVGALPLPHDQVADMMADGDTRWINRGAYDLMDVDPKATASQAGLPRARALYGSLPDQLSRPDSFVSQLRAMLKMRQDYRIYAARQVDVPDCQAPGLLVMVHELPNGRGTQVTALNFGAEPVDETVQVAGASQGRAVEMFSGASEGEISSSGDLRVRLDSYSAKSYLIAV